MTKTTSLFSRGEISVTAILERFWAKRGLIIMLPLIGIIIGSAFAISTQLNQRGSLVQHINLIGIQKKQYPNGTTFSPQDLLNSEVMTRLAKEFGLKGERNLRRNLSVGFSSPITRGIVRNYDQRISHRNLRPAEIRLINAEFSEELNRATENTLRISFAFLGTGLSQAQAGSLMQRLPQIWAEVYTTRFRTLDSPALENQALVVVEQLSTPEGAIKADKIVAQMRRGLVLLSQDDHMKAIQTAKGATSSDLHQQLNMLSDIYLSAVISKNLTSDNPIIQFYVKDITLEIEEIEERLAGLDATISNIKSILSSQSSTAGSINQSGSQSDGVQLGGDAFRDILALANRASLSTYLTDIFSKQDAEIEQRAALRKKLKRITRSGEISTDIIDVSQKQFEDIILEYNELLKRARDVNLQNAGALFIPFDVPHSTSGFNRMRLVLIMSSMFFLSLGLALVAALFTTPKTGS